MNYTLWVGEIKDNTLNNILISLLKCKYNNNLALDGSFRPLLNNLLPLSFHQRRTFALKCYNMKSANFHEMCNNITTH